MSLVIYPDISRRTLYSTTWKDELYNKMYKSLYDKGILKILTDKGKAQDEDGSNSDCTYLQLFYLEQYINYLILLKDEATKTTLTEDELVSLREDTYKLKVVRANFLCRFGNANNIDIIKAIINLGTIAGINNLVQDGLDYMIFDPIRFGDELITNGDFELPADGSGNIVGWLNDNGDSLTFASYVVDNQFAANIATPMLIVGDLPTNDTTLIVNSLVVGKWYNIQFFYINNSGLSNVIINNGITTLATFNDLNLATHIVFQATSTDLSIVVPAMDRFNVSQLEIIDILYISPDITLEVGKSYQLSIDIITIPDVFDTYTGQVQIYNSDYTVLASFAAGEEGTQVINFTAIGTKVIISGNTIGGETKVIIDNVSIKEITTISSNNDFIIQ